MQQAIFSFLEGHDCIPVAQTSKLFYEEAMNIVWINVRTLIPFVKCMPPEVLSETTRWVNSYTLDVVIVSVHYNPYMQFFSMNSDFLTP